MVRVVVVLCTICLLGSVAAKDDIDRLVDSVEVTTWLQSRYLQTLNSAG